MSSKAIREIDGKNMIAAYLAAHSEHRLSSRMVHVGLATNIEDLPLRHPWLLEVKLVAKPDQVPAPR